MKAPHQLHYLPRNNDCHVSRLVSGWVAQPRKEDQ